LTVNGQVSDVLSLSIAELQAYPQHFADWNNGATSYKNGTGPYILDILKDTMILNSATTITLICSTPPKQMSTPVSLSDLRTKYTHSVIAINSDGTLQCVFPDVSGVSGTGKYQVTNIDTIIVS
jgi:hypothetical protein